MCEPVTIMSAALAIGGAYMQDQQMQAAADSQNAQHEQNRVNSLAAMRTDYRAVQDRMMQEDEAAGRQKEDRELEARRELSSARVASGEAGITGFSVDSLLADISAMSSRDVTAIDRNKDWQVNQLNNQLSGIQTTTQSRINGVSKATGPSKLALGLNIASAGVGAADTYQRRTGKNLFGSSSTQ